MNVNKSEALSYLVNHGLWIPGREFELSGTVNRAMYQATWANLTVLEQTNEPITILLNTPGGNWVDGMAIYGAISRSPNHITIIVTGQAASMGALILQAADRRVMWPHATVMVHDGSYEISDTARNVEAAGKESDRQRVVMYNIFSSRTGRNARYYRQKGAVDWYLNADEAVRENIADEVAKV